MAHAAVAHARPGEVLVLTMTEPAPVALVGDLLVTQAIRQGVAALLVDGAVRDVEELQALGLPVWARWVRARGSTKEHLGELDVPVVVGGAAINPGDVVVLDADGAAVVPASRVDETVTRAQERERSEVEAREQYLAGALSYDTYGLRSIVEHGGAS
jgi:4-hydroxy-4-methyl-2-oxoglutarate aldolase